MMLGAQFTSLGIVGFMIYRGCKKNDAYRRTVDPTFASLDQNKGNES